MRTLRRILTPWRRLAAMSIAVVIVLLATYALHAMPPASAAPSEESAATSSASDEAAGLSKATAEAGPDQDTDIESASQKLKLHMPKGAVQEQVDVEITEHGSWGPAGGGMLKVFELHAFKKGKDKKAQNEIKHFDQALTLTIQHDAQDLAGFNTDTLSLYYLDETTGQWTPVPGSRFDPVTNILTATTDHFSYYGENADPDILGPGRILDFQVGLQSGAATASYPIDVPPGSGGFQPNLQLTYNSAFVDEMKNRRTVGSWVGLGWSLSLGSVSYDPVTSTYYLSIGGASSKLIKDSQGNYHTTPESFCKITQNGNQWDVYDRDGRYYRFGGTTDSQQYYNTSTYYRWDLSYTRDANSGNAITIDYQQDTWTDSYPRTHVRSAYPWHVRYNNDHVEIQFNSTWDVDVPGKGHLRRDNPQNPVPRVIENKKLDSMDVKVDGNLVRKYLFTYDTTDFAPCPPNHYNPTIDYAGLLKLTSITEVGADGTSQLPVMSLTYADKQIYHNDPGQSAYNGNPGNPATLTWPYLSTATNGYGATVTYSYTQMPSGTPTNVWTREIVTGRTINPGTGPQETHQYTYTGNPQYMRLGPGTHAWNDLYEGFTQVRETDAQGNYVEHYFFATATGDADYFTGKEYKTEWYSSSAQLLEKKEYTWAYRLPGDSVPAPYSPYTYWKLDENTGQTVADSSGNGYNGTRGPTTATESSDPAWTATARFGSALTFDGSNDFVKTGNYGFLNPGDATNPGYTLSAWVKRDSLTNVDTILASGTGASTSEYYHQFVLEIDTAANGNRIIFKCGNATKTGCRHTHVADAATISDTCWHHVVVKMFGATSWIYIDGVLKSTKTNNTGTGVLQSGLTDNRIGSRAKGANYFHGKIDDVRIYKAQLTDAQIADLAKPATPFIYLSQVTDTIGSKVSRARYEYDAYGNVTREYQDGDTSISTDDVRVDRVFYPNTSANILDKVAEERVYDQASALKKETLCYYDGNNTSVSTPPTTGNLTRTEQKKGDGSSVSSYNTYDSYGKVLTETDANGNTWQYVYESTYNTFPQTISSPIAGQSESHTFDAGTGNLLSRTDVNSQVTSYEYDTFGRATKVIKPGDSSASPTVQYQYNNWGTLNQQHLKTLNKVAEGDYLWKSEYFDGLGRVIQTQARGETGRTIIASTTTYNNRALEEKTYVSQDLDSSQVNGYKAPDAGWKYASKAYDGLGRVTSVTAADGTITSTDYSLPWQQTVTNPRGYKHRYYYDAFGRLTKVEELDASQAVYSTTAYSYDTLGNLVQVVDGNGNTTTMNYNWLGRKTSMADPDMGSWSYQYDANGNSISQTDAKGQTITLAYDALNRLTGKTYPAGSGMTNVSYTYDSTAGGNYGKGQRTGITDAAGTTAWKYDARGRVIEEKRTIDSVDYVTQYTYDAADRQAVITYPTGETVNQTYNMTGLPNALSGSAVGNLVTSTLYNQLGEVTRINLANGLFDTFAYYGLDAGAPSGYYGRLWQTKTSNASSDLRNVQYTWDADGNLTQRQDVVAGETETFAYDFLDRLLSVSGPYSQSYAYDKLGNITSMNGTSYTYSTKPHAVTAVGSTTYTYDANGNMTKRSDQTITWDTENRVASVSSNSGQNQAPVAAGDTYYAKKDTALAVGAPGVLGNDYDPDGNAISAIKVSDPSHGTISNWNANGSFTYTPTAGYTGADAFTYKVNDGSIDSSTVTVNITVVSPSGGGGGSQLVLDMPLNEGSGNVAHDNSGHGHNGTILGTVQWDSNGLVFGPSQGRITIPGASELECRSGFRIEAQVRPTEIGSGTQDDYFVVASYYWYPWGLMLDWGKMETGLAWVGGDSSLTKTNSSAFTTNTWYSIAVEYDATTATMKFYVGGNLVDQQVLTGKQNVLLVDESHPLSVGYTGADDEQCNFKGCIKNLKVYSLSGGGGGNTAPEARADSYCVYANGSLQMGSPGVLGNDSDANGDTLSAIKVSDPSHGTITNWNANGSFTYTPTAGYSGTDAFTYKANDGTTDSSTVTVNITVVATTPGAVTSAFLYDGDGNRVKKTEGGQTILYVNKYYEKNLTTGEVTTHYFLGDKEIAYKNNAGLKYVHQDHLSGTAVTTNSSGSTVATIKYFPFGATRSTTGTLDTDKKFTGQRLDQSGLYFYNARYYDATIGRFISPDALVQNPADPQTLNRYSYCGNNPLKWVDPTGHITSNGTVVQYVLSTLAMAIAGLLDAPVVCLVCVSYFVYVCLSNGYPLAGSIWGGIVSILNPGPPAGASGSGDARAKLAVVVLLVLLVEAASEYAAEYAAEMERERTMLLLVLIITSPIWVPIAILYYLAGQIDQNRAEGDQSDNEWGVSSQY